MVADPAVVRSYYEHIDNEEYEEVFALFAEDIQYERPGQATLRGMDEFRKFYIEDRPLEDSNHDDLDLIADGDTVAVRGTFRGTQDGSSVSFGFADIHEFDEDGLITKRYTYTDRDTV